MSAIYSLYPLYPKNLPSLLTSTRATVPSNEGTIAQATVGAPAVFTFPVPDGLWQLALVEITVGGSFSGSNTSALGYNVIVAASDLTGSGTTGPLVIVGPDAFNGFGTSVGSGDVVGLGDEIFTDTSIAGLKTYAYPLAKLSGVQGDVQGYTCYSSLINGTTATVKLGLDPSNKSGSSLTSLSAVMTLQSISPLTPYAVFSGMQPSASGSSTGGSTVQGSAEVVMPPTDPSPYDIFGGGNNGFGPFTYLWTVYGTPNEPDGISGQPTHLTGAATTGVSWEFDLPDMATVPYPISMYTVGAFCAITNSPYPHQADAPRTGNFGTQFYITIPVPKAIATALAACALGEDAHRRPIILTANHTPAQGWLNQDGNLAQGINGLVSLDAGRTYQVAPISDYQGNAATYPPLGFDHPSLIVDRRSNHYRAVYSNAGTVLVGPSLIIATGILDDRFTRPYNLVVDQPPTIPNLTGGLPAACQHPLDQDYVLLVYSDIGLADAPGSLDLKTAFSMDCGATWEPLSTVLPALDLRKTGRPALCWLGNTAVLVYSSGNTLFAMTSLDRGKTWSAAPAPISVYTPSTSTSYINFGYYSLSLAQHGGLIYLLAFAGDTQNSPGYYSPRLFISSDGGKSWKLQAAPAAGQQYTAAPEYTTRPAGVFPMIAAPFGIGVNPFSGRLRLNDRYISDDGGLSWSAARTS